MTTKKTTTTKQLKLRNTEGELLVIRKGRLIHVFNNDLLNAADRSFWSVKLSSLRKAAKQLAKTGNRHTFDLNLNYIQGKTGRLERNVTDAAGVFNPTDKQIGCCIFDTRTFNRILKAAGAK